MARNSFEGRHERQSFQLSFRREDLIIRESMAQDFGFKDVLENRRIAKLSNYSDSSFKSPNCSVYRAKLLLLLGIGIYTSFS